VQMWEMGRPCPSWPNACRRDPARVEIRKTILFVSIWGEQPSAEACSDQENYDR
jgi:hypothetical protein